jgi:hypothetical protein
VSDLYFRGAKLQPDCGDHRRHVGRDPVGARVVVIARDWPPFAYRVCERNCGGDCTRYGWTAAHALRRLERDAPHICESLES